MLEVKSLGLQDCSRVFLYNLPLVIPDAMLRLVQVASPVQPANVLFMAYSDCMKPL